MDIDVNTYLTVQQQREIATEAFRDACIAAFKKNPENLISNIGHETATRIVAEALGDDADAKIAAKAVEVIDKLSEFTVFRRPDVWEHGPSPAYQVLMKAVTACAPLIEAKMRECIQRLNRRDALEMIKAGHITISTKI